MIQMNVYLEKVALTRLVKELAKKPASRSTLSSLFDKGVIRSPGQYAEGMRKGNNSLAQKVNATISTSKPETLFSEVTASSGGYATVANSKGTSNIYHDREQSAFSTGEGPFKNRESHQKQFDELMHQAGIRHEVFEARAVKDSLAKGEGLNLHQRGPRKEALKEYSDMSNTPEKTKSQWDRSMNHLAFPKIQAQLHNNSSGQLVGSHMNLSVLGRESELIRKNPYLHRSPLATVRSFTGENKYIQHLTGKKYGADKITGKDISKLTKAPHSDVNENGLVHKFTP